MEVKTELVVAYCLAIVLFVAGVVCYAAFPGKSPEEPIRIMLTNTAGNILFNHKEHASKSGYGLECNECHHMLEDDEETPAACGECHEPDSEDPIKRSDAFHSQCKGCHEDSGSGPVQCSDCHVM